MFLHAQALSMKQVAQKTWSQEVVMLYLNMKLFTELKVYFYIKHVVFFSTTLHWHNVHLLTHVFVHNCRIQCKRGKAVSALPYTSHVSRLTLWAVYS